MRTQAFKNNRLLQALICWLIAIWTVTAINPLYPRDWLLENLLVFIFTALLALSYRKFTFSNLSYTLFVIFISLHLGGAHYTYSETPFGFWMQDLFGFSRNHYDRLVHFSFGLLLAYPFREILLRKAKVITTWSYFVAIVGILGFSALYEVLEGIAAFTASPELGTAYLGTQGDQWDSQKDTFMAFAGSIIAMLADWVYGKTLNRREP
jgi:putative membrane protein